MLYFPISHSNEHSLHIIKKTRNVKLSEGRSLGTTFLGTIKYMAHGAWLHGVGWTVHLLCVIEAVVGLIGVRTWLIHTQCMKPDLLQSLLSLSYLVLVQRPLLHDEHTQISLLFPQLCKLHAVRQVGRSVYSALLLC